MFSRTIKTQPQTNPGQCRWVRLSERPVGVKGVRAEMHLRAACGVGWETTHLSHGLEAARSPGRGVANQHTWTPLYLSASEKPGDVALPSPNRQPVGAAWRSRGGLKPLTPRVLRSLGGCQTISTAYTLPFPTLARRPSASIPGVCQAVSLVPPHHPTKKPRPLHAAGVLFLTRPGPTPDRRHPIKDRSSRRSCCPLQASHTPS